MAVLEPIINRAERYVSSLDRWHDDPSTGILHPMKSSAIHQYLAYLLIALLPLQAVAASRLAICAELMEGPSQSAVEMEHCEQMADMPLPQSDPDTLIPHPHQSPGCWLGSICLVGAVAFALPMKHQSTAVQRVTPLYLSAIGHYRSVILDSPQRPPTTL